MNLADAAAGAATETLLNCFVRETQSWRIEDKTLAIALPNLGVELRARLQHESLVGRHRYELPVELTMGRASAGSSADETVGAGVGELGTGLQTPIGFSALAGLLLDHLDHLNRLDSMGGGGPAPGSLKSTTLLARMLESLHNVTDFLRFRRDDIDRLWSPNPLGFLQSEQALLLGHPLHPTPKSRQPMTRPERDRYSPETQGSFPLHWLAVAPDSVKHASATGTPATAHCRELAEACGVPELKGLPKRVLLPGHPWEVAHLRRQPDTAELFDSGAIVDLGTFGNPVSPTTSVRTVYREDWPWQLKFSLHVRVTNSMRVSLPKELDRAVEAARLWQTEVGVAAERVAPSFRCIHDPAYLTVLHEGRVLNGFSVLLRENPWKTDRAKESSSAGGTKPHPHHNVSCVTSLCQDHPFGGPSRLARIVHALAARQHRPVTEVGEEWFARFLDVAVVSLVRLYLELGLCFEPHQQNTLLELDQDGVPVRCLYRDSQGYFHRELAHADLCRVIPRLGEASESIFPEALADERLVYYPFLNLTLGVIDALGAGGCADEAVLLARLRACLEAERARDTRYPPTLLDRLLDDEEWPCKANLRTRLHDMDELVGDIANQSVYVRVPNPFLHAPFDPTTIPL